MFARRSHAPHSDLAFIYAHSTPCELFGARSILAERGHSFVKEISRLKHRSCELSRRVRGRSYVVVPVSHCFWSSPIGKSRGKISARPAVVVPPRVRRRRRGLLHRPPRYSICCALLLTPPIVHAFGLRLPRRRIPACRRTWSLSLCTRTPTCRLMLKHHDHGRSERHHPCLLPTMRAATVPSDVPCFIACRDRRRHAPPARQARLCQGHHPPMTVIVVGVFLVSGPAASSRAWRPLLVCGL